MEVLNNKKAMTNMTSDVCDKILGAQNRMALDELLTSFSPFVIRPASNRTRSFPRLFRSRAYPNLRVRCDERFSS